MERKQSQDNPYGGWTDAIKDVIDLITKANGLYFGQGLTTTNDIYTKYVGDGVVVPEDINVLNQTYVNQMGADRVRSERDPSMSPELSLAI